MATSPMIQTTSSEQTAVDTPSVETASADALQGTELRGGQLRSTKQRSLIFDIVHHSHSHPSAEEVYKLARRKLKTVSLGTVYRNLRLLVEEGKIREVQFGGVSRFDGMLESHEHFVCTKCGAVADLPASLTKSEMDRVRTMSGGEVVDYRLDFFGLCKRCK